MYKVLNIQNADLKMKVCSLGATIMSLEFPDKYGKMSNLVLGYPSVEDYIKSDCYFGAVVGRAANRIANASFKADGKIYNLSMNEKARKNHLHGGFEGFNKKNWSLDLFNTKNAKGVVLKYLSEDGEEGYNGNLDVEVKYLLTDDNELVIKYEAHADKLTACNLTQHTYFNFSQEKSSNILNHNLQINSDFYVPCDLNLCPNGEILSTKNTALDFSKFRNIGNVIEENNDFFKASCFGLDHNFIVNDSSKTLKKVAILKDDESAIKMQVHTSELAMQVYTGNFLDTSFNPKTNSNFEKYAGVCLETQGISNSLNHKNYPSILLSPDEIYSSTTKYCFSNF